MPLLLARRCSRGVAIYRCDPCARNASSFSLFHSFSLSSCRYYFSERVVRVSTAMGASVVPIVESVGCYPVQMSITVARRLSRSIARSSFSAIADPSFALLSCGASTACCSCSAHCLSFCISHCSRVSRVGCVSSFRLLPTAAVLCRNSFLFDAFPTFLGTSFRFDRCGFAFGFIARVRVD